MAEQLERIDRLAREWPAGTRVIGPFVLEPDGYHSPGVGVVDPRVMDGWSTVYVPVRVLDGDRASGGYRPAELDVWEE